MVTKQLERSLYRPAVFEAALSLTQLPMAALESTLFSLALYWVSRAAGCSQGWSAATAAVGMLAAVAAAGDGQRSARRLSQ